MGRGLIPADVVPGDGRDHTFLWLVCVGVMLAIRADHPDRFRVNNMFINMNCIFSNLSLPSVTDPEISGKKLPTGISCR